MKKMVSVLSFIVTLVIFAADMYFGIAGSIDVKLQFADLAAKGASGHELWGVGLDVLVFSVVLLSIIGSATALISRKLAHCKVIKAASAIICPLFLLPGVISVIILSL
jgi:uncharacterized membrane protein